MLRPVKLFQLSTRQRVVWAGLGDSSSPSMPWQHSFSTKFPHNRWVTWSSNRLRWRRVGGSSAVPRSKNNTIMTLAQKCAQEQLELLRIHLGPCLDFSTYQGRYLVERVQIPECLQKHKITIETQFKVLGLSAQGHNIFFRRPARPLQPYVQDSLLLWMVTLLLIDTNIALFMRFIRRVKNLSWLKSLILISTPLRTPVQLTYCLTEWSGMAFTRIESLSEFRTIESIIQQVFPPILTSRNSTTISRYIVLLSRR